MKLDPLQRNISYAILVVLWSLIALNIAKPCSIAWLQQSLFWTGLLMSVVHTAEVFVFYKKLKPQTNKLVGIIMLYLFGIVYASGLDESAK